MRLTDDERKYLDMEYESATESCIRQYGYFEKKGMSKENFAHYVGGIVVGLFLNYKACYFKRDLNEEDSILLNRVVSNTIEEVKERLDQH